MANKESEQAKRKARSERFGNGAKGIEDLDEETARKLERAQRFGLVTADTEAEKKRMRSLRFGT
ncbi:hypothetical protein Pmar_PMAR019221 [Perkinsus marinus ATCC 50983]|uniref:THO1-MOS11 C-terminal domain-containing protein n=1 Tax=Perkinsus marinus (strain ATCC 50983 / TXsc) TaxID=423536 RepID=C5KU72_PERM5|nr:hypothetical protein Pmar_PMAR019221 [Perkinsus marinus ATCC 50983]EER12114.1 hypothetical protein Pmar_PMAR019221 [Perkinsus marinus ATCC 50983]|eukprot:XP_002780319.1 hypothetical protein Pmar_PMAR019221 [Perkinsus marinus ATCC 50983]